ncbi:MAG: magnesium transporter [Pseudohongiellaceae bacterium]|jgi:magnesium transporter
MDSPELQKLVDNLEEAKSSQYLGPVGEVHAADIASALLDVDPPAQALLLAVLDDEKASEVLALAEEPLLESLLERLDVGRLVHLLDIMDPDDAADVLEHLPDQARSEVLAQLNEPTRRSVTLLGAFEPDSAGGVMTTEVVAVGSNETVSSALGKLAEAEQPEAMGVAYVVDPVGSLVGSVDLKALLNAAGEIKVASVMETDVVSIEAEADQEDAARLMDHYHITTLPVVDGSGALLGVITADDIIDVLAEEASEDMLRLAGTGVTHPTAERLLTRLLARAPWLSVTLIGTFFAGMLIEWVESSWFELPALDGLGGDFKSLLYFIPLIGGMAGNVGSQSSTIMVRGFATGEVDPTRPSRVLPGELILALAIGLMSGVAVGCATALVYSEQRWLGLVVGVALPCAVFVAGLAGTLVPFACHRFKVDPAYASGPFLLTMNDIASYLIYFSVAIAIMNGLEVGGLGAG